MANPIDWTTLRIGDTMSATDEDGIETPCRVVQTFVGEAAIRLLLLPLDGGYSFVRTISVGEKPNSTARAVG